MERTARTTHRTHATRAHFDVANAVTDEALTRTRRHRYQRVDLDASCAERR